MINGCHSVNEIIGVENTSPDPEWALNELTHSLWNLLEAWDTGSDNHLQ